jgi:nicotinamidase-related amidase
MGRGLVLVDVQRDYFPGGRMELVGMEAAAARAERLLALFRKWDRPIVHLCHVAARKDAGFFLPGTEGVEIHDCVRPEAPEPVIQKTVPNGFRGTALLDILQASGLDDLVICGAMSHMCIDATTRGAVDAGFRCTVIHDACATRSLTFAGETVSARQVHAAFMAALAATYARVLTLEEFVAGEGETGSG